MAIIISHWEFGPALTSYCTHRRTSNSPQTAPIVGSRFSDQAHYNEFVESGAKSWALMRRRLVLEMKGIQNRTAQRPKEKGPSLEDGNAPTPLDHAGASLLFLGLSCFWASPSFEWSLLLFIHLFRSSSSYTCQLSMPILKCMSPQPFFLALCELLWPPSPCPGVTSTSKGVRVLVVCI